MGDLTYTPMYNYVYNYRPPPTYTEVTHAGLINISSYVIEMFIVYFIYSIHSYYRLECGISWHNINKNICRSIQIDKCS